MAQSHRHNTVLTRDGFAKNALLTVERKQDSRIVRPTHVVSRNAFVALKVAQAEAAAYGVAFTGKIRAEGVSA